MPAPNRRRHLLALLAAVAAAGSRPTRAANDPTDWQDADIVLFRHAEAPGFGDPPQFSLTDCGTQRNLDEAGREQARRIGQALRARGARVTQVWSSQWCRCRETARQAFPEHPAREEPVFNSFFSQADRASPQTEAARALLRTWRGPGVLVVVTHQVNITGLTGVVPASGEGLVLRWQGERLAVVRRLEAPPAPPRAGSRG
jgi:phosphohistidine phosphatase SixA